MDSWTQRADSEKITRHAGRGAILDANVLVLWAIGSFRIDLVERLQTTSAYSADDFTMLQRLMHVIGQVHTTPHVLAEVNALTSYMKSIQQQKGNREVLREQFLSSFAEQLQDFEETFTGCREVARSDVFRKLGLTDAAVHQLARDSRMLVVTDDFRLYMALEAAGLDVLNFNHLRNLA